MSRTKQKKGTETINVLSGKTAVEKPVGKKLNPEAVKKLGEIEGEEFNLSRLSSEDRKKAEEIASVASAFVMKGLLNRIDPEIYPVSTDPNLLEAAVAKSAKEFSTADLTRLRPKLEKALEDKQKLSRLLGSLKNVDFQKAGLSTDLKKLTFKADVESTKTDGKTTLRSGKKYNRLDIVLRALHCVDETNPESGTDDMILGCVLVGASGNTKVVPAFFAGEFNDGDYQNFGSYPLGQYSLNTTSGYPKSFYCIFKLVESDSNDAKVAKSLTNLLSMATTMVVSAVGTAAAGVIAGALVTAIGNFAGIFFDEDDFPPYAVNLHMTTENQFGGSQSGNLRTGNIRGHGGIYRIGYRWVLNA
jgi:hypothetical protein